MQIILAIILNSRATTSLQTVKLLQSFVCLLIDTEQSPHATTNPFVAIREDNGRDEIGEKDKYDGEKSDVRLLYDAHLTVNERQDAIRKVGD